MGCAALGPISVANASSCDGRLRYVEIVPNDRVVQTVDFVSDAHEFAGTMTMTWLVGEDTGGIRVEILAENVPDGISAEDHTVGLVVSLDNLSSFVAR